MTPFTHMVFTSTGYSNSDEDCLSFKKMIEQTGYVLSTQQTFGVHVPCAETDQGAKPHRIDKVGDHHAGFDLYVSRAGSLGSPEYYAKIGMTISGHPILRKVIRTPDYLVKPYEIAHLFSGRLENPSHVDFAPQIIDAMSKPWSYEVSVKRDHVDISFVIEDKNIVEYHLFK